MSKSEYKFVLLISSLMFIGVIEHCYEEKNKNE